MSDSLTNAQQFPELFDRVAKALVEGKSVVEISDELDLPLPELVDRVIHLIARYGLAPYLVYWATSAAAREALASMRQRWLVIEFDPRNLELLLGEVDLPGVEKDEVVLAAVSGHMLNLNAYSAIANCEGGLASLIRTELGAGFGPGWWKEGVPLEIRKTISAMVEEDPEPMDDKTSYLTICSGSVGNGEEPFR